MPTARFQVLAERFSNLYLVLEAPENSSCFSNYYPIEIGREQEINVTYLREASEMEIRINRTLSTDQEHFRVTVTRFVPNSNFLTYRDNTNLVVSDIIHTEPLFAERVVANSRYNVSLYAFVNNVYILLNTQNIETGGDGTKVVVQL